LIAGACVKIGTFADDVLVRMPVSTRSHVSSPTFFSRSYRSVVDVRRLWAALDVIEHLGRDHRVGFLQLLQHDGSDPLSGFPIIQTLIRGWAYAVSYPSSWRRTLALRPWLSYYNVERPHAALDYQPPCVRFPRVAQ
jgi:transposase InsO family protein